MNIAELEAALKARIDDIAKLRHDHDCDGDAWKNPLHRAYTGEIDGLSKALTHLEKLKQSVEAKRDEIEKMCGCGKNALLINKHTAKKLIDEIIGLSEERKDVQTLGRSVKSDLTCSNVASDTLPVGIKSFRKLSVETFDDGLTRTFSDVSRCPACSAMTHTIHPQINGKLDTKIGKCGKCGAVKEKP